MFHLEKLNVIQHIFTLQVVYRALNLLQIAELKLQGVNLVLVLLYIYNIIELLENLIVILNNRLVFWHFGIQKQTTRIARMCVQIVNHELQAAGLFYELFQSHFFKS